MSTVFSRFSCLPVIALVASPVTVHLPLHLAPHRTMGLRYATANKDTSIVGTTILLTAENLTAYVSTDKALETYWGARQDLLQKAKAHSKQQAVPTVKGISMSVQLIDYAAVALQDTAVMVIFTQHHMTPEQYAAIQDAMYHALGAVIAGDTANPATVEGKNMTIVQAHHAELDLPWKHVAVLIDQAKKIRQMIMNARPNQMNMNQGTGGNGDLAP